MTDKENKAKLLEIKEAMRSFPKELRRQERFYQQEMKIRKAFGGISLRTPKIKTLKKIKRRKSL